jgi:transcriptional regulator with XRE-family HTH domain
MAWSWEIEDLSLAVRFLRALRGWTQTELAGKAGWDKSRQSLMESGKEVPDREDLQRLARAVGLPFVLLEVCLPLLRLLRLALGRDLEAPAGTGDDVARAAEETAAEIAAATRITMTEALLELELLAPGRGAKV